MRRPSIRPGVTVSGVSELRLRADDFDYELPPEAIAQVPAEPREHPGSSSSTAPLGA
jgi:hypothetical protein